MLVKLYSSSIPKGWWGCVSALRAKTGLFSEEKQTKLKTIRMVRIALLSKQVFLSYNCPYPALLRKKSQVGFRIEKDELFILSQKQNPCLQTNSRFEGLCNFLQGPAFYNDGILINRNGNLDVPGLICSLGKNL